MKHSELNGIKYCLNLFCSFFFIRIMLLLTFCQDSTYLKPGSQQSDSGTSQATCHKIQTASEITIITAQNTISTVQLFHEYRLPEKPAILDIC